MIEHTVWVDQDEFNSKLRSLPFEGGEERLREFLRDMVLNLFSEGDELLRTTSWKAHRRPPGHRPNREHRMEECIDIFKMWLTIVQGCGFSQQELMAAYWRKSMVVRQRHSEEFLKTLDRAAWVVDIDNVLCDYTGGFCEWLANRAPLFAKQARAIARERRWFRRAQDFGMTEPEWQGFKHEFRSMGHKRGLPEMPGAVQFLKRLHAAGYYIILLTSRPIDRYPNIYTDTVDWLNDHGMEYDWLWWSADKGERLIENGALKFIRGAVDDDIHYVEQLTKLGIKAYWLMSTRGPNFVYDRTNPNAIPISTLAEIDLSTTTKE